MAEKQYGFFSIQFGTRLLCALLCCLIFLQQQAYAIVSNASDTNSFEAYQAAEILQIRPDVDRLLQLEQGADRQSNAIQEELSLRALILRKVLLGSLDVHRACSNVDAELQYTYALIHRQQRKQANVSQIFNLLNFAQLSAMYTTEPYLQIKGQFQQSGLLTTVSAGIGTGLPILNILYNKFSKAHPTAPPNFLANVLNCGPVNTIKLSPLVERFLDSPDADGQMSYRQAMFALWKKRYKIDVSQKGSLGSLRDGGGKSLWLLNTRITLLWSIRTTIGGFDHELLALLKVVQSPSQDLPGGDALTKLGLKSGACEAAKLLKIQPAVEELVRLNKGNVDNSRKIELEIYVLERVLAGTLETRIATDKIFKEINYAYDVVLAQLLARRGKGLQLNYEANFIQTGVFGSIAGLCYLKGLGKAGDELFIIQSGIATALSTLAMWQMRGGSRKVDTPPNSLNQLLNPDPESKYLFSPLVWDFLNAPSPESKNGKSRRDFLIERWKERHVSTSSLDSKKNQEKLAATLPSMRDTIKIVVNRIDLLQSLRAQLEELDSELFDLSDAVQPVGLTDNGDLGEITAKQLNPAATEVSKLLRIQPQVEQVLAANGGTTQTSANEILKQHVFITRRIFATDLDVGRSVSELDAQIVTETAARDKLIRLRDLTVNLTNNANFFQLGILGMIIDGPLGLSSNPNFNYSGQVLNIVSGYLTGGLAGLTVLEQPGLFRLSKAEPNTLGSVFGLKSSAKYVLSPTILTFLNSVAPSSIDGLSRKDELLAYWTKTKAVSGDVNQRSTLEKLAADGPSHHFWSETIKLMDNRLRMLYDLRATIEQINFGMSDVLRALD